ncbi:Mitochondrial distribution and morphology protein 12, partial [Linderina macrospora]
MLRHPKSRLPHLNRRQSRDTRGPVAATNAGSLSPVRLSDDDNNSVLSGYGEDYNDAYSNRDDMGGYSDEDDDDDDDMDAHQPNLHFGESDAGSDVEHIAVMTEQDAENAAAYLESVVLASGNTQVQQNATRSMGTALTRTQSINPAIDQGTSGTTSGETSAGISVPQENLTTIWKTISGLILAPGNQQLFQIGLDLKYPLDPTEHVIAGSPIIVRESEPSSIIAFTLMASEYRAALQKVLEPTSEASTSAQNRNRLRHDTVTSADDVGSLGSLSDEPSVRSPRNEFAKATPAEHAEEVIEYAMLHAPLSHLKLQFNAGRTLFKCKVMFAPQFDGLRRCNGCEDSYIESLSRCAVYDAQGGKSGSAFLETRDKRFIIKQVPKAEMDAFEKLAPFYFEHMYRTYRDVMHTLLAKIFGVCRITYRNAATGKSMKMNVVVMENLFYRRKCSRVFDLKGSERNRMVDETEGNSVFQDQNLLKLIRENPICIRQLTKQHLHDAIWNDTLFLSKMNVMDYSLLVGFDENSKELVVGIVDFIRTFTWDKKLESW